METAALILLVVGLLAWGGAAIDAELRGTRARRSSDPHARTAVAAVLARRAGFVLVPGALLALTGGVMLVSARDASFDDWWTGACLGAWLVAFFGSAQLRPSRLRRLLASAEEHGTDTEDVRWRLRQVLLVGRGELLLLAVAVAVLVAQPS